MGFAGENVRTPTRKGDASIVEKEITKRVLYGEVGKTVRRCFWPLLAFILIILGKPILPLPVQNILSEWTALGKSISTQQFLLERDSSAVKLVGHLDTFAVRNDASLTLRIYKRPIPIP